MNVTLDQLLACFPQCFKYEIQEIIYGTQNDNLSREFIIYLQSHAMAREMFDKYMNQRVHNIILILRDIDDKLTK